MRGFTLIELLIVMALIGVLAALAVPDMRLIVVRTRQAEALANLKGLYSAERTYFMEHDTYGCGFQGKVLPCSGIGYSPPRGNRYALSLAPAPTHWQSRSARNLTAPATGTLYDGIAADAFTYQTEFAMGGNVSATGQQAVAAGAVDAVAFTAVPGNTAPASMPGVVSGSKGSFAAVACGNIDADRTGIDKWFISSQPVVVTAGNCVVTSLVVPAGVPGQLYNDVSCDN